MKKVVNCTCSLASSIMKKRVNCTCLWASSLMKKVVNYICSLASSTHWQVAHEESHELHRRHCVVVLEQDTFILA